jgi:hypothetical protein
MTRNEITEKAKSSPNDLVGLLYTSGGYINYIKSYDKTEGFIIDYMYLRDRAIEYEPVNCHIYSFIEVEINQEDFKYIRISEINDWGMMRL